MSATYPSPTATSGRPVLVDLLRSEARKVLSVKLWWAMGLPPLAVGLLAGGFSLAVVGNTGGDLNAGDAAGVGGVVGLFTALYFLLLFGGIFGAVNAAGEHRHKTITTTFLTSASRGASLSAKLVVTAVVGLVYAVVIELVTLALIAVVGSGNLPDVSGTAVAFLGMAVVVTTAWTLLGAGLGTLLGSSVGATVGIALYYLFGELLLTALLGAANIGAVAKYLPAQASLGALVGVFGDNEGILLPWWGGLGVLVLWVALLCGGGWARNRVRDVG